MRWDTLVAAAAALKKEIFKELMMCHQISVDSLSKRVDRTAPPRFCPYAGFQDFEWCTVTAVIDSINLADGRSLLHCPSIFPSITVFFFRMICPNLFFQVSQGAPADSVTESIYLAA